MHWWYISTTIMKQLLTFSSQKLFQNHQTFQTLLFRFLPVKYDSIWVNGSLPDPVKVWVKRKAETILPLWSSSITPWCIIPNDTIPIHHSHCIQYCNSLHAFWKTFFTAKEIWQISQIWQKKNAFLKRCHSLNFMGKDYCTITDPCENVWTSFNETSTIIRNRNALLDLLDQPNVTEMFIVKN